MFLTGAGGKGSLFLLSPAAGVCVCVPGGAVGLGWGTGPCSCSGLGSGSALPEPWLVAQEGFKPEPLGFIQIQWEKGKIPLLDSAQVG